MRFECPSNWSASTILNDVTTEKKVAFHEDVFEFYAIRGHGYEVYELPP
jgi:hypothetical protein